MKDDTSKARMDYLMTSTGSVFNETDYQALSDQIEVHKYLINQSIPWTITWDDAAFSWLENVYLPIMQVINKWEVRDAFAHKTLAQLFFDVSNHWYYLLEKHPRISADYAAMDYAATYGKGLGKLFSKLQRPNKVA
ncbi:MAG: hypothetical protein WCY74_08225 [Sphaerochaetaceae bacterium]|jgi:hypothetical protein|nr:hypothetical protein [Sphaerochaetaceae bacterium]MDD3941836.1 hypothetical protein [Sphaerochaetaceae bacterium]MDX9938728.1 hypothetical protein [Sphaerochaetaceae bacterium]